MSGIPETYVAGPEAEAIDEAAASAHDRWLIFPLVLGLVLVALVLLLRSLVAPVLLVATVVATYVASLGFSWLVFTHVLGFDRSTTPRRCWPSSSWWRWASTTTSSWSPAPARRRASTARREGMLRGLAATGGVITSAGILLAAVFAVLGVLPLVVLAQLGVIVGIGVLLDTLLVRTVLVPALALLLGDGFWWPRAVEYAEPQPVVSSAGRRPRARPGSRACRGATGRPRGPPRPAARPPRPRRRTPGAGRAGTPGRRWRTR